MESSKGLPLRVKKREGRVWGKRESLRWWRVGVWIGDRVRVWVGIWRSGDWRKIWKDWGLGFIVMGL